MQNQTFQGALKDWRSIVKKYQSPNNRLAVIQIFNSFVPFLGLSVLMYLSLSWSYLITLAIAVFAALFLVRIFIIQHDCGHQSFFKSKRLNNTIGFVSSLFSTIPYKSWSHMHSFHHARNGQLEHRGLGDIYFKTTEEYLSLSKWGKFKYRIYRNPIIQFVISPIVYLGFMQRFQVVKLKGWDKMKKEHIINNILVLAFYGTLALIFGWQKILIIHLPVMMIFGIIAFWFFYIQHQHEENYNEWKGNWDHLQASILGSSYYKLPKIFQWFSGNIGLHHIHHLNSRIPNYNLQACARENPILSKYVQTINFRQSLKCINHKLWDADKKRMVSFKELR